MLLRIPLILVPWYRHTRNDNMGLWDSCICFHFVISRKIKAGQNRSKIEIGFLPYLVRSSSLSPCGFRASDSVFSPYNDPISILNYCTEQTRNIFSAIINAHSLLRYFLSCLDPCHWYRKWLDFWRRYYTWWKHEDVVFLFDHSLQLHIFDILVLFHVPWGKVNADQEVWQSLYLSLPLWNLKQTRITPDGNSSKRRKWNSKRKVHEYPWKVEGTL